jgi:hypothetical protein
MKALPLAVCWLVASLNVAVAANSPEAVRDVPDYDYFSSSVNGSLILRVSNPQGISFVGAIGLDFDPDENSPVVAFFRGGQGEITLIRTFLEGWDSSASGGGSHVVYARASRFGLSNPSVRDDPTRVNVSSFALIGNYPQATEGDVVIMWAEQLVPPTLHFRFNAGTSIERATESNNSRGFATHNFSGGVTFGVNPEPGARFAMHSRLAEEARGSDQAIAFVHYYRGETIGVGNLKIKSDSRDFSVSLDADYSHVHQCACLSEGFVIASASRNLELRLDFIGEGRTQVWGVIGTLDSNALEIPQFSAFFFPDEVYND